MAQNLFRLDGKIAFVSGSRGHLGQAMARALAGAGAHVFVNGRDKALLDAFACDLRSQGFSAEAAPASCVRTSAPTRRRSIPRSTSSAPAHSPRAGA